jgi:hypothetical protein
MAKQGNLVRCRSVIPSIEVPEDTHLAQGVSTLKFVRERCEVD